MSENIRINVALTVRMAANEAELNEPAPDAEIENVGDTNCAEDEVSYSVRNGCSPEVLERVRAIQWLASAPDRSTYLGRQQDIAQQFKLTIRQVQRLIRAWETSGITGLERKGTDRGARRLDEDWTNYIL